MDSITSVYVPEVDQIISIGDEIEIWWDGGIKPRRDILSQIRQCSRIGMCDRQCRLGLIVRGERRVLDDNCLNRAISRIVIHNTPIQVHKVVVV